MTPEEFRSLLDTYGADLTRWPHAKRQVAHRYMQDSVVARDIFAEAQEFDALLSMPEVALSDEKRDSLLDSILDDLPDDLEADVTPVAVPKPSRKPSFTPAPTSLAPKSTKPGLAGLLGEILVRPNVPIFAACFACGILIGAGLYMKQQTAYTSAMSAYNEPVTLAHLQ